MKIIYRERLEASSDSIIFIALENLFRWENPSSEGNQPRLFNRLEGL